MWSARNDSSDPIWDTPRAPVYDSPAYSAVATGLLSHFGIRRKGTPTLLLEQFTVGPKQSFKEPEGCSMYTRANRSKLLLPIIYMEELLRRWCAIRSTHDYDLPRTLIIIIIIIINLRLVAVPARRHFGAGRIHD